MKASKLLFVGITGASAEAIKNLVLAGMNITVLDSSVTLMQDVGANVLLGREAVGKRVSD